MFGTGYLLETLRNTEQKSSSPKKKRKLSPKTDPSTSNTASIDLATTSAENLAETVPVEERGLIQEKETSDGREREKPISTEYAEEIIRETVKIDANENAGENISKTTEIISVSIEKGDDRVRGKVTEEILSKESTEKIFHVDEGEGPAGNEKGIDETPDSSDQSISHRYRLDFSSPRLLLKESVVGSQERTNNFLKGCKWSPDGSCVLTNSDDRKIRVFTLPTSYYDSDFLRQSSDAPENGESLNLLSFMSAGDLVYDYCWYPLMNSGIAESCVYVQTSCDHPIQLCDALTGQLCATYLPIDHLDEVTCAYSLAFSPDGSRLYAGFNKSIRVFDTYRPGRQISTKPTWRKRCGGQSGIISCIAVCPTMPSLYACGSYSKTVATYADSMEDGPLSTMQAENMGGVTHLKYHPNGNYLFSGGRMDSKIISWDMRMPGQIVAAFERDASTNQRFYFDLDPTGQYLISGGSTGEVRIWDTTASVNENGFVDPVRTFRAHETAVNGVSLNPYLAVLVTASGQRHFETPLDENDEQIAFSKLDKSGLDNSLKFWFIGSSDVS